MLDASQPLTDLDRGFLGEFSGLPRVIVLNKADLPGQIALPSDMASAVAAVSCATGAGMETLKDAIDPNGILAPGKSGIWPKQYRGNRA